MEPVTQYLIAVLIIAGLLAGWIGIQRLTHRYAVNHPQFGPPRKEGSGCGHCDRSPACDLPECEDRVGS